MTWSSRPEPGVLFAAVEAIEKASVGQPLVLVRFRVPNARLVQWWLVRAARDVRTLFTFEQSAGCMWPTITRDLRTATARTVDMETVRDRIVYNRPCGNLPLWRAALAQNWKQGPRHIGSEYTNQPELTVADVANVIENDDGSLDPAES